MPYSNAFKDHIANPRHPGELAAANAIAEETNPVCGDRLRLSLVVREGKIEAASFLAYGCPPTLAFGSALTEMIQGKTVEEAMRFTRKDVLELVGGLPSHKHHAAALAIETLRKALEAQAGLLPTQSCRSWPGRYGSLVSCIVWRLPFRPATIMCPQRE